MDKKLLSTLLLELEQELLRLGYTEGKIGRASCWERVYI